MTRGKIGAIFLAAMVVGGFFVFSRKPNPAPIPFVKIIQQRPDYHPPGAGITLYHTGGPFGVGVVQAVAAGRDQALFVGTYGEGVFRSEDGGAHWVPANIGLNDKFILNITRVKEGLLFAGTIRAGLFISHDDGRQWSSANLGLENTEVHVVAALPTKQLFAGTGQGVYTSHDQGGHWVPFNEGMGSVLVRSIVADKDGVLYAATQGRGIFKRKPGEDQWREWGRGFYDQGMEERTVRTLVIGKNGTLFAGTLSAGVFRNEDGGTQWNRVNRGLNNLSIRALVADQRGFLYAGTGEGVFYSENHGELWSPWHEGMTDLQIHTLAVNESGNLYAGTGGGLFFGRWGAPWRSLHKGLLISPVKTIGYDKEGITVGTDGKGMFRSRNNLWIADNVGLVNLSVRTMARGATFIYIVTDGGVYKRQLGRHRWDPVEWVLPWKVASIGIDKAGHVYAGTEAGLFVSSNHGKSWTRVEPVDPGPVTALALDGAEVLAVVSDAVWIKSAGQWEKVTAPSPFQFLAWRDRGRLFAATNDGIWKGDQSGWMKTGTPPREGRMISFVVHPDDRDVLYIGSTSGLYVSANGGESWHHAHLHGGGVYERQVNDVLPMADGLVWLATEEEGVLLGVDRTPKRGNLKRFLNLR